MTATKTKRMMLRDLAIRRAITAEADRLDALTYDDPADQGRVTTTAAYDFLFEWLVRASRPFVSRDGVASAFGTQP